MKVISYKIFFILEEAVMEVLFKFGVSPFQFGFFIEPLDKVKML